MDGFAEVDPPLAGNSSVTEVVRWLAQELER
jgi:hypothetical protein